MKFRFLPGLIGVVLMAFIAGCGTVISTREKVSIDSTGDTVTTEVSTVEFSAKDGIKSDFEAFADIYRIKEVKFISENEGYFRSTIKDLDSVHFISRNGDLGENFIFSGPKLKNVFSVEISVEGEELVAVLKVSNSLESAMQNVYSTKQSVSLYNEKAPISQGITENSTPSFALPRLTTILAMEEADDFKTKLSISGTSVELSGEASYESCKANLEKAAKEQCGMQGYKQLYLFIRNSAENQLEYEGFMRFECK
jgi:hypothetical protein